MPEAEKDSERQKWGNLKLLKIGKSSAAKMERPGDWSGQNGEPWRHRDSSGQNGEPWRHRDSSGQYGEIWRGQNEELGTWNNQNNETHGAESAKGAGSPTLLKSETLRCCMPYSNKG